MLIDQVGVYRVLGTYPRSGYRAVDISTNAHVRIDIYSADDWRESAIQHLRASAILDSLDHPGIARIRGRGVLPDRRPYLASDLADGVPLCDLLANRPLAIDESLYLLHDLAEIAAHAHARRVVHSAIRPHLITMRTGERPFPIQLGGWGDVTSSSDGAPDILAIGSIIYRGLRNQIVPNFMSDILVRMLSNRITALDILAATARLTNNRVMNRGAA